jgi:hypothetical protein
MHRIHPTTGLTCVMRMKTLYAALLRPLRIRGAAPRTSLRSDILLYVNVRRSFQTIA